MNWPKIKGTGNEIIWLLVVKLNLITWVLNISKDTKDQTFKISYALGQICHCVLRG